MIRGRSFGGGRTVKGGIGSAMGTIAPRLPRLPGIGAKTRPLATPQMPNLVKGGYNHLDRLGIGAAELAQGHKKIGSGL